MKFVRDIMSPLVVTVMDRWFLPEACRQFEKYAISAAAVVNKDGDYVGFLSNTDISARVAAFTGSTQSFQSVLENEVPPDLSSVQVQEVMSRQLLKISAHASLEELGQTLLIAGVHRLLVVEEEVVVGLVSTTDLIQGLLSEAKPRNAKQARHTPYLFETELNSDADAVYLRTSAGCLIELESPPEFGGSGQRSSPEDLFVASISSCLCLTFRELAKRNRLEVWQYDCRAIGRLEGDATNLRFSRVDLYPKIKVAGAGKERIEQLLVQAKLRCLVGRSADVIVIIHPDIQTV